MSTGQQVEVVGAGSLYAGTQTVTTAAKLNSGTVQACSAVLVQADPDNTVDVFLGNVSSQSYQLRAGDPGVALPVDDVSKVYAKSSDGVTSARVNWLAV